MHVESTSLFKIEEIVNDIISGYYRYIGRESYMSKKNKIITAAIVLIIVIGFGAGILMNKEHQENKPKSVTLRPGSVKLNPGTF